MRFEQEVTEGTEMQQNEKGTKQTKSGVEQTFFVTFVFFCCIVLSFSLIGCGGSGLTPVSGVVTLDGQPLAEGTIHFAPADGQSPSQAAVIREGKFTADLVQTKYKVQIFAPKPAKVVAKLDENGPGGGPRMEELLPPRYNVNSELTLDVTGPTKAANFDLKSK
jgi:hypothetical protein